jgi:hypothetical protein
MTRDSYYGIPKVSPGPAMPFPSTPVSGVARLQGGRAAAVFHPFGHPTPYAYVRQTAFLPITYSQIFRTLSTVIQNLIVLGLIRIDKVHI